MTAAGTNELPDLPGGHSAKNARRAGAPNIHQSSQETTIMATRRRSRHQYSPRRAVAVIALWTRKAGVQR